MFSLFKKPEPIIEHYTAAEIHCAIIAKNLTLLNNVIELTNHNQGRTSEAD